ncbi:MAG TPA: Eco29kI family restriction endonuclease [Candidatus Angelobacter sp.]|nr:Eco29kI family restriction endonuclease [Candidatus Angelobacter sp.]
MAETPFNPLDKRNLGESVADALLDRPSGPLPPEKGFTGAGVYAIYYAGDFPCYAPLSEGNRKKMNERPIYVGKAVPPGARKGGFGLSTAPGTALYSRLREHARSIQETEVLKLDHFYCRYLIADDIWIPLAESLLIEKFKPVWNVLIEGFGIHTPGAGRKKQVCSKWDTLHPGRALARDLPPNPQTAAQLEQLVTDFFAGRTGPAISTGDAVTLDEEGEA